MSSLSTAQEGPFRWEVRGRCNCCQRAVVGGDAKSIYRDEPAEGSIGEEKFPRHRVSHGQPLIAEPDADIIGR